MMSVEDTLKKYDLFDNSILTHGFTDYMRDYQIVAHLFYGESKGEHSFLFRGCVEAIYSINLPDGAYSVDDTLIDAGRAYSDDAPFAFIWAVRSADVYHGWTYVADSARAAEWSGRLNMQMHEITIETNVYKLSLVFHGLLVEQLGNENSGKGEGRI